MPLETYTLSQKRNSSLKKQVHSLTVDKKLKREGHISENPETTGKNSPEKVLQQPPASLLPPTPPPLFSARWSWWWLPISRKPSGEMVIRLQSTLVGGGSTLPPPCKITHMPPPQQQQHAGFLTACTFSKKFSPDSTDKSCAHPGCTIEMAD